MRVKTIALPCFGIMVQLDRERGLGGLVTSNLHDQLTGDRGVALNSAIDGIESLILAHAYAGINIESLEYIDGIETAVDSIGRMFGVEIRQLTRQEALKLSEKKLTVCLRATGSLFPDCEGPGEFEDQHE